VHMAPRKLCVERSVQTEALSARRRAFPTTVMRLELFAFPIRALDAPVPGRRDFLFRVIALLARK
jgi:hypothetical protein